MVLQTSFDVADKKFMYGRGTLYSVEHVYSYSVQRRTFPQLLCTASNMSAATLQSVKHVYRCSVQRRTCPQLLCTASNMSTAALYSAERQGE
jgi:hypothetical protein